MADKVIPDRTDLRAREWRSYDGRAAPACVPLGKVIRTCAPYSGERCDFCDGWSVWFTQLVRSPIDEDAIYAEACDGCLTAIFDDLVDLIDEVENGVQVVGDD